MVNVACSLSAQMRQTRVVVGGGAAAAMQASAMETWQRRTIERGAASAHAHYSLKNKAEGSAGSEGEGGFFHNRRTTDIINRNH